MYIKLLAILLVLTFLNSGKIKADGFADSLLTKVQQAKHDTVKIRLYNQISEYYIKGKPDSAFYYVNYAIQIENKLISANDDEIIDAVKSLNSISYTILGDYYKAISDNNNAFTNYKKSLDIRSELQDLKGVAENYIDLGITKNNVGDYLSAEDYYKKAIEIQKKINDDAGLAKAYRNIGNIYHFQGDPNQAVEYYQKSLELSEKTNDLESVSRCYNNIAYIYSEKKLFDWAKDYYNKSLVIKEKLGDQKGIATAYNNIGDVYFKQDKYPEAVENYNRSLSIRQEIKDKRGEAISRRSIGKVFFKKKNYIEANKYYQTSLKIIEEILDLEQKSELLKENAEIYLGLKEYDKAIESAEKALSLGKQLKTAPRIRDAYEILAKIFDAQKKIPSAYTYYKKFIEIKDSINREQQDKTIENENRYRVAKKDQEIRNQKMLQAAEQKDMQMKMIVLLIGLGAMLLLAFVLYRNYKQKTRANNILEEQKKEIQKAKEEIEAQRDLVMEKNELILAAKKEIEDSIIYAKNIQHAVLPSKEILDEILPEHFIFWRPRNIVSGDFFWMKQVKNFVVITIADCTGHGVPGAFMSMLGLMFLNETVTTRSIDSSGEILNNLREKIKTSLHQSGKEGEAKDGMDISFFIINTDTYELQFSGAFNPLYIVRENSLIPDVSKIENENIKACYPQDESVKATLFEIKADRQPIAIYSYEKDFTTNVFQLQKGDLIYSFTDGYPDQFGGEEGKKFNAKRFKEFFLSIKDYPIAEQETLVEKNFYSWMGQLEQVDDVLLMGIKIG
jgi:tetratricopeptide (TPR) repeat protein